MNYGLAFQRSTRAFFRFFSGGFRVCPYLLDTVEEQIAAMLLVKWHRIVVAQSSNFYLRSNQYPAI